MRLKFINYYGKNKIVSIAISQQVREDLEKDKLDYIYVQNNKYFLCSDGLEVELDCYKEDKQFTSKLNDYDVYELWEDGTLVNCYCNKNIDNYFFVTGKCNSNCVMCPSPEVARKNGEVNRAEKLIEIAKHIPVNVNHLTITGGEPFMLGNSIFKFLNFLKCKFEYTEFLILTNGRIFAVPKYLEHLKETIPNNTIIGIPLHGSNAIVHDNITQVKGSYDQTVEAIENLCSNGIRVELRIVISKLNVDDFRRMVDLIIKKMSKIEYISIMAMEMTGNAYVNREKVWIPYREAFDKIADSVMLLIKNGIDVKLYNFPLCTVERKFWTLCEKSISSNKVRYTKTCDGCSVKDACGGLFAGTYNLENGELKRIDED